jgi:hypothetical protein
MKTLFSQPFSELDISVITRQTISRRTLVKGLGILTIASVLEPGKLFAAPRYNREVEAWIASVKDLASSICDNSVAEQVHELLSNADAYVTPATNDFHQSFSAPFFLDLRIAPVATSSGQRFFEFDQYPFYDSHRPCRRTKDVNEIELRRFLDRGEIEFYGGVVSPCSERRQLTSQCEREDFTRTAEYYDADPDEFEHLYTRNVTDGNKSYLAHAAKPRAVRSTPTQRRRALKQVFLSPDSL